MGFQETFKQPQRKKCLTDFLRLNLPDTPYLSIDPIYTGPYNKRVPTGNNTVTFTSQETRDEVLDKLKDVTPTTPDDKTLRLVRTKNNCNSHSTAPSTLRRTC